MPSALERAPHGEAEAFRGHMVSALGPQARLIRDAEGWPMAPGRYGRLKWRGAEATSEHRLYACTETRTMASKLRAIPGLHPQQVGDQEAAFWLRADDGYAIRLVARLLRLRRRRASSTGRSAEEMALMRATSRPQETRSDQGTGRRTGHGA